MNGLLDMDGVIADFNGGAAKLFDRSPETTYVWGFHKKNWRLSDKEFWDTIDANSPNFWKFLPTYPWTFDMVQMMDAHFGRGWLICSTPGGNVVKCKKGKRQWLTRLNIRSPIPVLFTDEKERYATLDSILIDDKPKTIDVFNAAGGRGILFPAPWNKYEAFDSDPVTFIERAIYEQVNSQV